MRELRWHKDKVRVPNQVNEGAHFFTHKCVTLNHPRIIYSIKIYEKKINLNIFSPIYLDRFLAIA